MKLPVSRVLPPCYPKGRISYLATPSTCALLRPNCGYSVSDIQKLAVFTLLSAVLAASQMVAEGNRNITKETCSWG